MRRDDQPPSVDALPELRLQAAAARDEVGDGDEESEVVAERPVLDALDHPSRDTAAGPPEGADRVVPDQQARPVAAERVRTGRERGIQRIEVVGEDRPFVRVEGGTQVCGDVGCRRAHAPDPGGATAAKSDSRIRACTPQTMSTTCEMSKSVAAERYAYARCSSMP